MQKQRRKIGYSIQGFYSSQNEIWFQSYIAKSEHASSIIITEYEFGGVDYWTGTVEWTTGLERWSGLLDWSGGVDYWSACHTHTPNKATRARFFFATLVVRAVTHEAAIARLYYLRQVLIWQLTSSTVCLLRMLAW